MCENNQCETYEGCLSWTPQSSPYVTGTDAKQQKKLDLMSQEDRMILANKLGSAAADYVFLGKKSDVSHNGGIWKICWDNFVRN